MSSSWPSLDVIPPGTLSLIQSTMDIWSSSRPRAVERFQSVGKLAAETSECTFCQIAFRSRVASASG